MVSRTSVRTRANLPASSSTSLAVWITDCILSDAISRYQRTFSTQCRHISSRPGPLESRRRLGRRGLTGLMPPHSSDYPPFWNFDVQVPTTWSWQPPTAAGDRHSKMAKRTLGNKLIAWLEDAQADKPFLTPPADLDVAEAELEALSLEAIPEELVTFRDSIMAMDTVTEGALQELRDTCLRCLVHRIENGFLSASAIAASLDLFNAASKFHVANATLEAATVREYRRNVLDATAAWFAKEPQAFTSEACTTLLKKLVSLCVRREDTNARFFRRFLSCVPESIRHQIPAADIFPCIQAMVIAHSSREPFCRSNFVFAGKFASPLKKLSMSQLLEIDKLMAAFLEHGSLNLVTQRAFAYSWLLIKAFHPVLSQRAVTSSLGTEADALSMWQLNIAHLVSIGFVDNAMRDNLLQATGSAASRWAYSIIVIKSKGPRSLSELCQFLAETDQLMAVADELTPNAPSRHQLQAARALAQACRHASVRLQLLHKIETTSGRVDHSMWTWSRWLPLLQHPQDPEDTMLPLLLKLSTSRIPARSASLSPTERHAVSALLDDLSSHFLTAPGLTDRQRLRRIELCIRNQRFAGGSPSVLSTRLLGDVTTLLARDLERGDGGRQTRQRWLLRLISSSLGPAEARRVKAMIRGWRRTNKGLSLEDSTAASEPCS